MANKNKEKFIKTHVEGIKNFNNSFSKNNTNKNSNNNSNKKAKK